MGGEQPPESSIRKNFRGIILVSYKVTVKNLIVRFSQYAVIAALSLFVIGAVGILMGEPVAHALPEYVERTGEPCSTCHVNPGGGGPRTARGLLWVAQGRPDQVPEMENVLIAPGPDEGIELYDIACASCHGPSGEGLFGHAITDSGISEFQIRSTILLGRERSGMPSFEGQFSDGQLEILVTYVTGIATGQIEPAPASYPLPPGKLECVSNPDTGRCGGN